jgi:diguanylate cyclase (GGDEF)-like protein
VGPGVMGEEAARAELGMALGRRAEECAGRAEERLAGFPWVGAAPSDDYLRTRHIATWFGTMLVARWLVCGERPSEDELRYLSERGRQVAEEGLSIVNMARGYLVWRDVTLDMVNEEAARLELDPQVVATADAVVRATCDGNLVRMARAFDEHLHDLSARLEAEHENLRHAALHDQVTGLPNRMLLYDRLAHAVAVAHRERRTLAVLLVDLDGFKEVNDRFGHGHGDDVLAEVARRLQGAVRAADTVARLGGDEFVAVLPGADESTALGIAERMLRDLRQPMPVAGHTVTISASVGVALYPARGEQPEPLLLSADHAMYVAKRAGGGVHLATPSDVPSNF